MKRREITVKPTPSIFRLWTEHISKGKFPVFINGDFMKVYSVLDFYYLEIGIFTASSWPDGETFYGDKVFTTDIQELELEKTWTVNMFR